MPSDKNSKFVVIGFGFICIALIVLIFFLKSKIQQTLVCKTFRFEGKEVGCDHYRKFNSGETEQVVVLNNIEKKGDSRYLNFSWIDKNGKVINDSVLIGSVATKEPVMAIFYQKVADLYPVSSDFETKPLNVEELESSFVKDKMAGRNAKIMFIEGENRKLSTLSIYRP